MFQACALDGDEGNVYWILVAKVWENKEGKLTRKWMIELTWILGRYFWWLQVVGTDLGSYPVALFDTSSGQSSNSAASVTL
jgi:hypothetical protein